jgi:ABC-type methionine transport system ATPase subunit
MPRQLSGGQTQKAAIARALVNQPSLIVADEPTGNLDTSSSKVIMELLRTINQQGNTILMVTHNPELTRYATRVIYMQDGKIRIDQTLGEHQQIDLTKVQDVVERQDYEKRKAEREQSEANSDETETTQEPEVAEDIPSDDKQEVQKAKPKKKHRQPARKTKAKKKNSKKKAGKK